MKKKDLKSFLDKSYKEKLKPFGFKKIGHDYIKSSDNFIYDFRYVIYDYGNVYVPEFSYGLQSKFYSSLVSNIYGKELKPFLYYIRQGTLFEKGKYPTDDYLLTSLNQAEKMISEVVYYFQSEALPFLESISNFKSIERLINENPESPTDSFQGLIIAKLVENPEYENLKVMYRNFFKKVEWAIPEDIERFEKLISFLENRNKHDLKNLV